MLKGAPIPPPDLQRTHHTHGIAGPESAAASPQQWSGGRRLQHYPPRGLHTTDGSSSSNIRSRSKGAGQQRAEHSLRDAMKTQVVQKGAHAFRLPFQSRDL